VCIKRKREKETRKRKEAKEKEKRKSPKEKKNTAYGGMPQRGI